MIIEASRVRLSIENLPDRTTVFVHRLVGEADEDRNRDDQEQAHHNARPAQAELVAALLDGLHVGAVRFVFVLHGFLLNTPCRRECRTR